MKYLKLNQKGTIFLTTMVSMFLMTIVGGYLFQMNSSNMTYITTLKKSIQAQQIADAGLSKALSTIYNNWTTISSDSNFPATSLDPGTFDVTVTTSGGRYLVTSIGTVDGVSRTASAEVSAPTVSALSYVFAGGSVATHVVDSGTGASPGTITGDIYSGGDLTLDGPSSGGVLTLTGDVDTVGTTDKDASVTQAGAVNDNFTSTVNFPTVDFSYYQTIAVANNGANTTYFNTNKTYTNASLIPANPPGGVIYVNGNITIQGTQTTTACIIATGSITVNKSGSTYPRVTVNQYTNGSGDKYPALMTQNGNIGFVSVGNGGAYLNTTGLVYSGNNFSISSGNHDTFSFTGSVLARGTLTLDLTAQNTLTVSYVAQTPPGVSSSSGGMEVLSYDR